MFIGFVLDKNKNSGQTNEQTVTVLTLVYFKESKRIRWMSHSETSYLVGNWESK